MCPRKAIQADGIVDLKKLLKTPPKCEMPLGRRQVCCRETAGGQSRWMARVEERFNSLPSPRPDLEWVRMASGYRNLQNQRRKPGLSGSMKVPQKPCWGEGLIKNRTDS